MTWYYCMQFENNLTVTVCSIYPLFKKKINSKISDNSVGPSEIRIPTLIIVLFQNSNQYILRINQVIEDLTLFIAHKEKTFRITFPMKVGFVYQKLYFRKIYFTLNPFTVSMGLDDFPIETHINTAKVTSNSNELTDTKA